MFLGVLLFIILMFLPSIIELKKPEDPGPRIIGDYNFVYLYDLDVKKPYGEIDSKTGVLILREVTAVLTFLPDLESELMC